MKKRIQLFLVTLTCFVTSANSYKKIIVDDKDALCLDGTPGVYYVFEGSSKTKFMIQFEGGGWCGDQDLNKVQQNLAVPASIDYIRDRSVHKNVYAAPNAGIFLDTPNFHSKKHEFRENFANLFKLSNAQIDPPIRSCVIKFKKEPYMCMFAVNAHLQLKTPLFAIQSLYDSWSIIHILGINCLRSSSLKYCRTKEIDFIEEYHKNISKILRNIGSRPQNGYWAIACVNHGFLKHYFNSSKNQVPMDSKNTIEKTLVAWSQKQPGNHRHMDEESWPDNNPCSGQLGEHIINSIK